jgi:hypothetical protein
MLIVFYYCQSSRYKILEQTNTNINDNNKRYEKQKMHHRQ